MTGGPRFSRLSLDRVQQRARRIEIERVAELVRLWSAGCLDPRSLFPRVVPPVAALPERSEQVAQRTVAEKIERFVGDLERDVRLIGPRPAAGPLSPLALGFKIRWHGDVAVVGHPFDDLLDQLFELRACVRLIAVGRIAEQSFDRLLRKNAAVEERVEDGIVERLHRPLSLVGAVRVPEAARQQQIRQLRDEILDIDIVEIVTRVLGIAIPHSESHSSQPPATSHQPPATSCSTSSSRPWAPAALRPSAAPRGGSDDEATSRQRRSPARRCG